jgi:hypothetical protein
MMANKTTAPPPIANFFQGFMFPSRYPVFDGLTDTFANTFLLAGKFRRDANCGTQI